MPNMPEEAGLFLEDLKILLKKLGSDHSSISPLRAAVAMKRIETAAKIVTEKVLEDASVEFQAAATAGKKLTLHGGILSAYSPATEWAFPLEIINLERQLKELKERAKADGTARGTKAADTKRAFKVETPFSGAGYSAYLDGAKALEKLL